MQEQDRSPRTTANQPPNNIHFQVRKKKNACAGLCLKINPPSPLLLVYENPKPEVRTY